MSMSARELLLDAVINQIQIDVGAGDFTAIYEMLLELPNSVLEAYLPEEQRYA